MDLLSVQERLFQLPSLGRGYEDVPFIAGDSVKLRPIVTGHQRDLAKAGSDPYRVYFTMLNTFVVEPKMAWDELLMGDVNAIMFAVRLMTYGKDYPIEYTCEECGAKQKVDVYLTVVPKKTADDVDDFQTEGLELMLNGCGSKITMHLGRLKDEKVVSGQMRTMEKADRVKQVDVDRALLSLAQLIDSIDGNTKMVLPEKFEFVLNLDGYDMNQVNDFIMASRIGLMPVPGIICKRCSWENEEVLQFNAAFFRAPRRVTA